jgi:hypothetical protein
VGPLKPSIRFPMPVSVLVPMIVRSGPGYKSEVMQSLLEQRDKTRYLPCPIFPSRPFVRLGRFSMSPGILHVIVGFANLPLGLALPARGFVDVMHHVRHSVVQFVQHMCGTLRNDNPSVRWGLVVPRPRVVWAAFIRAMLVEMMLVRAVFIRMLVVRAMRIRPVFVRTMFFGASVSAFLCKLLEILHLGLTSRVALVGARGVSRILVQSQKSA